MELAEIRLLRKKLGLTQHDLAKMANVSQSLIAKIESGKIDFNEFKVLIRDVLEAMLEE